jgi:hypothetical protein
MASLICWSMLSITYFQHRRIVADRINQEECAPPSGPLI